MTPQESGAEIRASALLLDGLALNAKKHSVRDLVYVLGAIGRSAILENIETVYLETIDRNPGATISRPSVYAMNLGNNKQQVLSSLGQHNRTNIHKSFLEIKPDFHDHWRSIVGYDFTPEVRSAIGSRAHSRNWLMLRNPETDPSPVTPLDNLPAALGFIKPAIMNSLKSKLAEALERKNDAAYSGLYDELTSACYEAVDRQSDTYGDEYRSAAQIGMIVTLANLGVELEGEEYFLDPEGYTYHLNDASNFANNMHMDNVDNLLRMEIERVRQLRDE